MRRRRTPEVGPLFGPDPRSSRTSARVMDEVIAELERTQPAAMARRVRIITGSSGSVRPAGLPPQDPLLLKVGPGRTQARGIAAQKNKSKKSCLFLPVGI